MDCNIQCCTLVIFVALAATLTYSDKICATGLTTPGFTEPEGDILLEIGQPLEINCSVYPSSNFTSSNLTFHSQNGKVDSKYLFLVNKTTLRLYIPNPPIQEAIYQCKVGEHERGVCLNKVIVGHGPQNVTNFTCVSQNWNDLNCSWIPPQNFIKTRYNLVFNLLNLRLNYSCPQIITNDNNTLSSCFWNMTTTPIYRQVHEWYIFHLEATNALGHNFWKFNINNFAAVVPDPPWNLSVINSSITSITLEWAIPPGLKNFPPGLIHKVQYKNMFEDWQEVNTKSLCVHKCNVKYTLELSNIKYPNIMYHIQIYSRSAKEKNTVWSEPAYIDFRTLPTLPAAPPRTYTGSFEITSTNSKSLRNVNLYWQEIPKYMENGDSFKYKILSVEENGVAINITTNDITKYYASFHNLSSNQYRFKVASENNVGISVNYSEIIVPAESNIPPLPDKVTQLPFNSDTYQLSWKEPSYHSKIDSFTVFWCKNKGVRPYPCSGGLDWITVPGNLSAKNVSNLTDGQIYQFGVSTNIGDLSSGIVWASCTVLLGRGGGKMKSQSITILHTGASYVHISWNLECSNQIGAVSGFHIEYCALNSSCESSTCDPIKVCSDISGIDVSDKVTNYNITGLKPYTNYLLFISVKSDKTKGVRSEAIHITTEEDVPDIINSFEISNITNTSVVLKWTPPVNNNGMLYKYLIQWGDKSKRVEIDENNDYILEGLESSKHYDITVSGCTKRGCGKPSLVSIVTRVGYPGVPTDIQISYINSSKVASWSLPQASAGNLTYYTVKFQVLSDGKPIFDHVDNTSATSLMLPWNKCETDGLAVYSLSVRASNVLEDDSVLEGPWAKPHEGACSISPVPPHLTVIIPLVAVLLSLVLCIFCALFSQHLWVKFNKMKDIGVKMPARLTTRQEDRSANHALPIWNNHRVQETDINVYRSSPDEQSLLKVKEEIELIQEDTSTDRESFDCNIIQNTTAMDGNTVPVVETAEAIPAASPSPGYIKLAPAQPSPGYVTIPLARGYMMATLPPSPNAVSPSLPQCSIVSHKQNSINSFNPKNSFNSFSEPNHFGDNMISPINST